MCSNNSRRAITLLLLCGLYACTGKPEINTPGAHADASTAEKLTLDVYKSPSCGCCGEWVKHIELAGFTAAIHHPDDLNQLKAEHSIQPHYQSCHTAITASGYVFEGHVAAKYVQQFLANPPAGAIGLAVPAMPVGSPGMEMGERFTPYQVLLLKADGSSEVFAEVSSAGEQY